MFLFHFVYLWEGFLYIFPPGMGRGLFLVFSTRDFFSSASRFDRVSSPYARSHKDDKEITDFLLCSRPLSFVTIITVWCACEESTSV